MKAMMKIVVLGLALFGSMVVQAFPEIPKASARALKITKGRPFSSGLVFVNGKYLDHPYTVERYGTGIRINGIQVTGQVIDWNEFLKTQQGVKVTKSESAPAEVAPTPAPAPEPEPEPEPAADDEDDEDDDDALDDLFDDEPKAKKKPAKKPAAKKTPVVRKAPPKPKAPTVVTTYALEGDFVANETTRAMVKRINAVRTEIDRILRTGGFICFGDNYSRVTGDARTAKQILEVLPEIEQNSSSVSELTAAVRNSGLIFFSDLICQELFRNRIDYRVLQERREKNRKEAEWKQFINDAASQSF